MLAEHGLQVESIGGDVVGVPISALKVESSSFLFFFQLHSLFFFALKNMNIDKLLESILAVAELQQLCGDPSGPVEGTILESKHEATSSENSEFDFNQRKG